MHDMRRSKLDMIEEIYVSNVGGYIDFSTRGKIEYVKIEHY